MGAGVSHDRACGRSEWSTSEAGGHLAMALAVVASLLMLLVVAGCAAEEPRPSGSSTSSGPPGFGEGIVDRQQVGGEVAGLVLEVPIALDDARRLAAELGGDLIAVYRSDYAFVQPATFGALEWSPEPSRFAYVDAERIRERRLEAIDSGKSPPITGMHISQSFWTHWEDQWSKAQDVSVTFDAIAVYLAPSKLETARADERFRAVEIVPSRRTESLSSDYPGELLLESEEFPSGHLTVPPFVGCG